MKPLLLMMTGTLIITAATAQLKYPDTKKGTTVDDYFGTKVPEPYRWLEDDNSAETKAWVAEENKVTQDYLATIPFHEKVKNRLTELWNYPKFGSPAKHGDYYYFSKNDGLQNQAVYYRQKGLDGVPEVFLDPNTISKEGIAAIGAMSFSKGNKYMAYTINKAGSDWADGYVMDLNTKQLVSDKIEYMKFSGFAWKGNEGFYYSRYPKPDESNKLMKQNEFQKVYYHKLGTPQSEDLLIYEDLQHPLRYNAGFISDDQRFLFIHISEGTSGSEILVRDLKNAAEKNTWKTLFKGFANEADVFDTKGDDIFVKTNLGAANYKIVAVNINHLDANSWKTIVPEQKEVLEAAGTVGGSLFTSYLKDASTKIFQYGLDGKKIREIILPGIGTAGGFDGEKEDTELFYTYTSFTQPPTIFRFDIATGQSTLFRKSEVKFDATDYETKQVFFTSKDGAKVPMFISYKKGMQLGGNNPTLVYGYGGFNIPMTPAFSISNQFFMEQGGIYVVVTLRGGNEYGENWHKAGMLQNKQNVFNDMIGAAEYLIENKYTNKSKLAIRGGSNGGLLVGAVITQRPDLFKVAIPQVGVMDMLRFQKFTVGHGWVVEYGSSDNEADFKYLYKYSPLHNLKPGTSYPATIVTTADHDDRVVPAHSFKFAAQLQADNNGTNPTLIRIDTNAGHGAGKPTSKAIEEAADIWSFVMFNLGMKM